MNNFGALCYANKTKQKRRITLEIIIDETPSTNIVREFMEEQIRNICNNEIKEFENIFSILK